MTSLVILCVWVCVCGRLLWLLNGPHLNSVPLDRWTVLALFYDCVSTDVRSHQPIGNNWVWYSFEPCSYHRYCRCMVLTMSENSIAGVHRRGNCEKQVFIQFIFIRTTHVRLCGTCSKLENFASAHYLLECDPGDMYLPTAVGTEWMDAIAEIQITVMYQPCSKCSSATESLVCDLYTWTIPILWENGSETSQPVHTFSSVEIKKHRLTDGEHHFYLDWKSLVSSLIITSIRNALFPHSSSTWVNRINLHISRPENSMVVPFWLARLVSRKWHMLSPHAPSLTGSLTHNN